MSRRSRSLAFGLAALTAAALAAVLADSYGSSIARGYGALRPVAVAARELPAGKPIGAGRVASAIVVRRIPARFVPPGALRAPAEALGLAPRAPVPAGSYLLASQLRPPREGVPVAAPGLGRSRHPVEITVSGAGALLAAGPRPGATRVDVVVTTEPGPGGRGRTYVAAARVPLLDLGPGEDGPGGAAAATLGLTREQALRLISAESFARRVTLFPMG